MYYHVEAVYRHSSATGATRAVLAYLAHRADEDGQCWPSQANIAQAIGATRKTVVNALRTLQSSGDIAILRGGLGRGNTTLYQLKGVVITPNQPAKGVIDDLKGEPVTPYANSGGPVKGVIHDAKGVIDDLKGVISATVKEEEKKKEKKKKKEEEKSTRLFSESQGPSNPEADALNTLAEEFKLQFRAPIPRGPTYVQKWQQPLSELLGLCDGNLERAQEVVGQARGVWYNRTKDGRRFGGSNPQSVMWAFTSAMQEEALPAATTSEYQEINYDSL